METPNRRLKLINKFFTIPDRSWPGRMSRRREGEHAEDISAHKPGAFWSVREFECHTSVRSETRLILIFDRQMGHCKPDASWGA